MVFIIDNLQIGGAEQVFVDIVNLCNYKIDFDVLLITNTKKKEYSLPENIRVIRLNRNTKYSIFSLYRAKQILKSYNVAHVHMRHTYRYLALVQRIFRINTKFIFHDHYGSIDVDQSLPFKGANYIKPDFYIGVCPKLQNWAIDVWKIPTEKTIFLNNLPSLRFNREIIYLHEKFDSLVMVGNIKPIKNQVFALELVNDLSLKIDFIGKKQDQQYFNELNEKLSNNVILENCDDVSIELPKYKLALFTSLSESGPLVLLEYLLCGLPFISFKTGGISEILVNYFPDFFIDNFNKTEWKERISKFMMNPPEIDKLKLSEIIQKEFNRDVYFNRLIKIYNEASA